MAISAFTKTTWANSPSTSSPVSAANLQHIEDQVKDITDAAVSGGASPTKLWSDTNDGNLGQPPMPRVTSGTPAGGTDGPGKLYTGQVTGTNTLYYSGSTDKTGTWLLIYTDVASGVYQRLYGSIGNGAIGVVAAGSVCDYVCWRLS